MALIFYYHVICTDVKLFQHVHAAVMLAARSISSVNKNKFPWFQAESKGSFGEEIGIAFFWIGWLLQMWKVKYVSVDQDFWAIYMTTPVSGKNVSMAIFEMERIFVPIRNNFMLSPSDISIFHPSQMAFR